TKREGKPFAVIWLEDLTGSVEVVVWNDVYTQVSEVLATGRVVEIRATLDTRGDSLRATAQRLKLLSRASGNGAPRVQEQTIGYDQPPVLLQFSTGATRDELHQVRQLLASSPGDRCVQLLFDRPDGNSLRVDAGPDC